MPSLDVRRSIVHIAALFTSTSIRGWRRASDSANAWTDSRLARSSGAVSTGAPAELSSPPLEEGRLVQVLADEEIEGPLVHAVCAPDRRATARVPAAFEGA